jgi:hypothetical protein
MNAARFWRHAGFGLVLSGIAGVLYHALSPALGSGTVLRGLLLGVGAAYLALLLHDLRVRHGLMVTLSCWAIVAIVLLATNPALWLWLLSQALMIWLARCLYRYDRLANAVLDAGVCGFAVALAFATADHTHSLFLTLWSGLLVQALVVFIPSSRASAAAGASQSTSGQAFDQAHRTAEFALRRLAQRR